MGGQPTNTVSVAVDPNLTPSVLVVDDEPAVARTTERLLGRKGYRVTVAHGGQEAIDLARADAFDAIVSDLDMPDVDGRALLRAIRKSNLDVPFVFLTGNPDLQSAIDAVEYGAFRYLVKPVPPQQLFDVVSRAVRWHRLAVIRREAAGELEGKASSDRAGLEARFSSALEKLWIACQPIVSWQDQNIIAYETLVRTDELSLRNPVDLFEGAEKLGRTEELGRAIRGLVANLIPRAPASALVFVNLHPNDLADEDLYASDTGLAPFAHKIVLEITERAALDEIRGLRDRVERLRAIGYRIAVDDLGAGYAGLSSFAALEPDVVKADMSLVRGIDSSAVKRKVVAAIAGLAKDLGIQLVAEGIETPAERDCVVSLGADALQGYLFARPDRGFPSVRYT
ncbi:MAG TPA: EAL domain-containing response regulator [Polyangia bacterium]|nr:EAL domain-containing response regulator [Polyangia bacterium]